MPLRVATNRRRKIARLSFRKKRNNNTRRKVKHRRYDKIPKTKRPIYSGGGSLGIGSGNVVEQNYYLQEESSRKITGRVNPMTYANAFRIELSRGTFSATFGGNYTLKMEIDMSKYKHDTEELVSKLFFEIFGVDIPFDFADLVDLDHVLQNFDDLNKGGARNVNCYGSSWNKLITDPINATEDPTPRPLSKCVVTFEFKIKENGRIEFTSISFTAIQLKNTKCQGPEEEIDVELPGYGTIIQKTPGVSISTLLKEERELLSKIGEFKKNFNVCVVPKSTNSVRKFYSFDSDLMAREDVKAAVTTFKERWDYVEENKGQWTLT
jgi:hypothetical protein